MNSRTQEAMAGGRLSAPMRHRIEVMTRAVAGIGGGYVLSSLCAAALALFLPLARAESVITGTLASFVIYTCAVMWAFAARSAAWAWGGLAAPAVPLAIALWLRLGGAS